MKFTSSGSDIDHAAYDSKTKTLTITFKTGGVYHYNDVSLNDYEAFKSAKSHGSHFHSNIKTNFKHTKGGK